MGKSDTDQVKLHFEIRRFGKPVDPMTLLPQG
jgi:lipoprotein NlpD